ncbi:hypothetical protein ACRYCC_10530 [Actinomadura scrupuli]|uniref:hypothetical protein n=1 Tax=Actinomadura scrupuli TaxID=559629 RepID=UPI003D97E7D9
MIITDCMPSRLPTFCPIFGVDIVGFGRPDRDDEVQITLRDILYAMIRSSYEAAGLAWARAIIEDRGDGMLIIPPADDPPTAMVDPLLDVLRARLHQHNRLASPAARIQLRAALHMGLVHRDKHGVAGSAVNHMFRLLDTAQLRDALDQPEVDLAFIASQHVYDSLIRVHGSLGPENFLPVECRVKETAAMAWITIPVRGRRPILSSPGVVPLHRRTS